MKSQFKRFSKSTLSVILAFCMLVSCVTAGIIATGAAVDNSEKAGAVEDSEKVAAVDDSETVGAATQRYIYCGISNHFDTYKDSSNWGFNFWGGTSAGVKTPTYIANETHDGRTYHVYRVQVYDDNNKAQFKGNDNWWVPSNGFSVTLNGTTNNAVYFSASDDGWDGQFQKNYQVSSSASLSASSTSITTAQSSTLTPSLSSNATYNTIKSTTYEVTTNPGSAGSVTSAGVFSATAAGTYTVTATVTYNAKGFSGITKTATATKEITVTSATYNVSVSAGANGSAIISKNSPVSGSATSVSFNNGTTNNVYVKATPNQYYKVDSWSPTPSSTSTDSNGAVTATFSVSSATSISVSFAEDPVYSVVGDNTLTGTTNSWDISSTSTEMTKSGNNYAITFNNIAAGTYQFKVAKNHAWDNAVGYSNNVSGTGLVTNVEGADDSNNGLNIQFTLSESANVTITYTSPSTVVINAVSNLTKLATPTNVKINNKTSETVAAAADATVPLTWTAVSNAGSYKIYKDSDTEPFATVSGGSTTTYNIPKKHSNSGVYYVVAVPSNTSLYSESNKSSGVTLTVTKNNAPATPSISIDKTAIGAGESTTITVSNAATFASNYTLKLYKDNVEQSDVISNGTFTVSASGTYKVKAIANDSDYYADSSFSSTVTLTVYTSSWYLVGSLVDSTDNKWNNQTTYPVDTFVSANVFKRTVTYNNGGTNERHHFRIYNGSNQYTVTSGVDTDMSTHNSSGTAVTASTATTNGSMYVTGQGEFNIYVDQSGSSPKVWVVKNALQTYTTTVYVNQDSGATNLYAWKDGNNEVSQWPGELITGTTETVNDIPYYKYIFEGYWDHINMVPNKSNGSVKTADITNVAANATYYITWDGENGSTASISTTAPVVQLGYKIGENGTVTHVNFSNRSVSVNLAANTTYDFWMKSANTHYNDQGSGTMTRANCTNWAFNTNTTNTKITTDLAGTYTFTYTVSGSNFVMSVTYPTEQKYNVTISQGDHGTLKVNDSAISGSSIVVQLGELTKAMVEAVAAEGYHFREWTYSGGVTGINGSTKTNNPISNIGANDTGTMTANYDENTYTVTLQSGGNGTITAPSPAQLTAHPYTATSLSGVTVSPATGYKFNGWTTGTGVTLANGSATSASAGSITASQNSTMTANFTKVDYTITYPSSPTGYTLGSSNPTSAQYQNNVSFTVTPSSNYRIDYVRYTPAGGAATACTAGGNNEYHFTMPDKNVTITVGVVRQYTITLNTSANGFNTKKYAVGSGADQTYTAAFKVDTGSTVALKVTYSNGYEYDSANSTLNGAVASNSNQTFTLTNVTANKTVTLAAKKTDYKIETAISPNYGTLKLYSDSGCTTELTKKSFSGTQYYSAQYGDTFYAKYVSPTGGAYALNNFTVTGTGTSNTGTSGNIGTFTMGYSHSSVTANLKAVTPSFSGTWSNVSNVIAGTSFTYTGHGTVSPSSSTYTYSFNGSAYQSSPTFTAPTTKGTFTLIIKATNSPTGVTAVSNSKTVTVSVIYDMHQVTYYVDMHNNTVNSLSFALEKKVNSNYEVLKDNDNKDCIATLNTQGTYQLTKQGSSTVYAATIATPVILSGSTYSDLYFRITFNGTNYRIKISGGNTASSTCIVDDLINSGEIWLEAVNESSQTLSINYSTTFNPETGSTPAVATGYRRIYLAKPYGWQDNETKWKNIKVYHWGNYNDMGWNNGISMSYLGYGKMPGADSESTDVYHYYYVDLPKYLVNSGNSTALSDATNGNKVQNIIFQGWADGATSPSVQTGNIEEIPDSADFFILSKDGSAYVGTRSDEDVIIPTFARHATRVEMNVGQTGVNIAPVKTGANVTYESSNPAKVSVSSTGEITASASTVGETNNEVTITVKVYGSIGDKIRDTANGGGNPNNGADAVIYTVTVSAHNPSNFNGFEIMSLESQTYTVNIPTVDGNQPGYFDMSNVVMTVEGIKGVTSSTNSAIITQTGTTSVSGVGTACTAFTVKYAKANSVFTGYNGISIIGKVVTKSIRRDDGDRYGHNYWTPTNYTTSRVISDGIETATTEAIPFNISNTTYSAVFAKYTYVDVTFTFNYYEYNPKKVDSDGNVTAADDGMIQYPYDAVWAGNENTSSDNFAASHTLRTVTVQNYEVRGFTVDNITTSNLANAAPGAIDVMPENNYYNYTITAAKITKTKTGTYTANAVVNMTQNVKQYKVYVNGQQTKDANNNPLTYTYQEYAEPTVNTASNWYAVDTLATTSTANAPMLASGVNSYKFRVKGNTYLRTVAGSVTDQNFNRSEVDFSHYEVTHQGSSATTMKEYLLQNFYIADFFSPAKVLDPASNNGQGNLPYDDAQFVGGGVVYYSMNGATENNQGTPFANAVSSGYVNGSTGKINEAAIKEMLKRNIEAQYGIDDIAGDVGEEEAMKVAYGTEIEATKNVEGGFNTGIIYRYLPLNQYNRDGNGNLIADGDGNYTYDVNKNTFRYSNSLQSYQYVYASGNENKATNQGKNMRLYSYYVYSYVTYNQETNVPETRYDIKISANYSDASTYWDGQS